MKEKLLSLRPTQFCLGMEEVDGKIKKMREMSQKKLKYCDRHEIPVVKGPRGELYLIDHHHFARACWELSVDCYKLDLKDDLSHLTETDFWVEMKKRKWCYLRDQFGEGPRDPALLPSSIRSMADDPYRSLVWMLIAEDVIQKEPVPFFEFAWAEKYRKSFKIPLQAKSDFRAAVERAKDASR